MSKDENGRATADYIARILGLEPYPADMMVIMTARNNWDEAMNTTREPYASEVLRHFTAKYGHLLLEKWQELDQSHATLYSEVLRAITRNLYFDRLRKEYPLGETLVIEHARRLSQYTGSIAFDRDNFAQSVMLLWQLLVWRDEWSPTCIPSEISSKLIRMIKEFLSDCPGAIGTSIGEDCMLLLKRPHDKSAEFRARLQRSQWTRDIDACSVCQAKQRLLRCSKCKVVAYCGAEHQRSDWRKHKIRCFKVIWED